MKDPAHRTKVVLRRLPPAIAQQAVVDQVDARFAGRYDWACFRPGNASQKNHRYSRLYLNFKRPEDVYEFAEFFNGHVFVNEKGAQFKALVEYAPSQQVPKSNIKKDGREGTILKDPEYLEFLERISKPTEHLPSAEIQLERKEAERAAAGKEAPVMTPLMIYVRQQRAAKSMAQRSGGRLSRKMAVAASSSSPAKRSSEKRRSSTSTQYVVRDSAKEKPTYILASRREEHREKANTGPPGDATSGGTSGSVQVMEGKRDKIVLLKGRARVDPNTSDSTTQQQSVTPVKNAPPSSSRQDQRLEASGRIIKTILSNKEARNANAYQHEQEGHALNSEKDKRPPRVLNPRSIVKDHIVENAERSQFEEKPNHHHGSVPIGEKIERHARNRDRPDRGVWAPRKSASGGGAHNSSSEFPLTQSHPGDNLSQQTDSHGERKTDPRSHGGSRGGPVENGNRHATRRGPPRGLKETEISATTSDGKTSKRGPASYGAHEINSSKQILQVEKLFSFSPRRLSGEGSPSQGVRCEADAQLRVRSSPSPRSRSSRPLAADAAMQRYGLQLRTKPAASSSRAPPRPARPLAAFADDGDDDVEAEILRQAAKQRALQKVIFPASSRPTFSVLCVRGYGMIEFFPPSPAPAVVVRAQVEEQQKKAMEEDPSVFAYDEVYDEMKEKAARPKMQDKVVRESKYIAQLKEKAEQRKREQDIIYERKLQKERSKEDHLFGDKDKFVTSAYRKKLEEQQKWLEEEKRRQRQEEKEDVTKKKDLSDFYFGLQNNVAFGAETHDSRKHANPQKSDNKPDDTKTNSFDAEASERSPKRRRESSVGSERAKSVEHPSANRPERAKSVEQPSADGSRDSTAAGSTEKDADVLSNASQAPQKNTQPAKVTDDHYKRTDDALAAARARALARKKAKEQQL
ncbi:hypothetical protein EJB05_54287 [Eragrostis curvula]|uniref:Uncharacterized protein n=1 Tax=Eragrostis curvula TaxID=38414 RepID=A0A5J9SN02_9POAL|nr:hypothetical protein EJB05_54287 [Eragrostis curvula]